MTPPRRPARSAAGGVLAALVVIGLLVAVVAGLATTQRSARGDGLVPADVARDTPVAQGLPLADDLDVAAWAAATSASTGVPERALAAYGAAEIAQRAATPGCRLSWSTLAGIARVESDHGGLRAELGEDGVSTPLIVGIALDGSDGVREILDTDGGELDGDTTYDRAVGPLQFLPTTWDGYGADGNGDGLRDPHQIDDAAAGAAAYLCAEGRDTADGAGWWDGVLTYNRSGSYARTVWAAADRYATASLAPPAP